MLQIVDVPGKSLEGYRSIVGDDVLEEIRELGQTMKGARVAHINATAFGGGVAEILQSLVPLMKDVGLDASWQVIQGSDEFFNVTKACHNGLQGMDIPFTAEMKSIWEQYNRINAEQFEGEYDFVVVHDPQPAGFIRFVRPHVAKHWIWRCHIDTSNPNPEYWQFFLPYINAYEAAIFTMKQYVGPGVTDPRIHIIAPTIDPLTEKNREIPLEEARQVVSRFGVRPDRPLITQVSRFDPWKDPLGVIDAYRQVKPAFPEAQLALVGSMATDDPEGWYYLDKTCRHAGEDDQIFILHNFHGVGAYEVGCFQTVSDVIVQKSIREGFGLVVTEALWKGKPVVGGEAGGIPLQVIDGQTGFLVRTVDDCAARIRQLLEDPELARKMGQAGKEHVRQHFLITRHLKDYLQLFRELAGR
ncbi:MAG: glycosyltransferase [Calditrichaeota bacterium]|nr:glycosyltransferase [Calditrichota bacterium]